MNAFETINNPEAESAKSYERYRSIYESLLENETFETHKASVMEKFSRYTEFSSEEVEANFDKEIIEALTVLESHHGDSVDHSIRTLALISEKLTREIPEPRPEGMQTFSDMIEPEIITKQGFFNAAVSHDIGKILVPTQILDNAITREEWQEKYDAWANAVGDEAVSERIERIRAYNISQYGNKYVEHDFKAHELLPLSEILDEETHAELVALGLNPNDTLKQVIDVHEGGSADILNALGYTKEAILAGQHHHITEEFDDIHTAHLLKIGADADGIKYNDPHYRAYFSQLAYMIHIADVTDALTEDRAYSPAMPDEQASAILVEHAEEASDVGVEKQDTYYWLEEKRRRENLCGEETDSNWCQKIIGFLKKMEEKLSWRGEEAEEAA